MNVKDLFNEALDINVEYAVGNWKKLYYKIVENLTEYVSVSPRK